MSNRPGSCELRLPAEVDRPDLVRVADLLPDVVAAVVDRAPRTEEVHGADHVVEVALQEIRDAILAARHEIALDTQPERCAADELDVVVEVVEGLLLPVGVVPDLKRLGEAVDVLGDAELDYPVLFGRGQVAVDVPIGEVGARLARVVRAKVEVVVGEHAPKLPGARLLLGKVAIVPAARRRGPPPKLPRRLHSVGS